MPLSVQKIQYKMLAVALSVALVVCAVLHPMQARAASTDLDYIETNEDIGTIKAEIVALPAAALAIVLGIIGFIALTYVVARNVSVPIEYSPGASFWDKCTELGQYCFDNATQALAPVFKSVQTFVEDNPQLGTWGALGAFTALHVSQFFTAISAWLSSTFVGADITTTAAGLIETAKHTEVAWSEYGPLGVYEQFGEYPYYEAITDALVQYVPGTAAYEGYINPAHVFGYYYQDYLYGTGYQCKYRFYEFLPAVAGYTLIIAGTSAVTAGIYALNGTTLVKTSNINGFVRCLEYRYNIRQGLMGSAPSYADLEPNLAAARNISVINNLSSITLANNVGYGGFTAYSNLPALRDPVSKFLSLAILAGMQIAYYTGSGAISSSGIAVDSEDLSWITEVPTAANPPATQARDTILNPGESVDVDIGRIADALGSISEQVDAIAAGLAAGSTLELLKLLLDLTSADTLTQTAVATSSDPNINTSPVFPIPGLGNIWKYVTYMFSTLGGWITFCGNCLQSVTVGQGGLSWIFYGAFIFLICGGVISKLLL